MKENKIKVTKYNSSLDDCVQNLSSYEGFIQVENGKLVITHKKPSQIDMFVNVSDPHVIKKAKDEYKMKRSNTLNRLSFRLGKPINEDNGLINDHVLK